MHRKSNPILSLANGKNVIWKQKDGRVDWEFNDEFQQAKSWRVNLPK